MPKVDVYNMSGDIVEELQLDDKIFGIEVNETALHSVVVAQLSNARQGNQSTKTRAEVRGGGKKPWRQKGTGRARHGSSRSPIWTGGGVTFAPKPRSYRMSIPKKVRRLAMKSALTSKVNQKEILVLDDLAFDEIKTRKMVELLGNLKVETSCLIVLSENDKKVIKSADNIQGVKTTQVNTLNVYDILKYDRFIITKAGVKKVEEVYA
ncbi:MAG: 50S ribosomal protein L4 [Clostridia bacterium]